MATRVPTAEELAHHVEEIANYRCCGGCVYWLETEGPYIEGPFSFITNEGECRRLPPMFQDAKYGRARRGYWPETDWDDYCGEFNRRAAEPPPDCPDGPLEATFSIDGEDRKTVYFGVYIPDSSQLRAE